MKISLEYLPLRWKRHQLWPYGQARGTLVFRFLSQMQRLRRFKYTSPCKFQDPEGEGSSIRTFYEESFGSCFLIARTFNIVHRFLSHTLMFFCFASQRPPGRNHAFQFCGRPPLPRFARRYNESYLIYKGYTRWYILAIFVLGAVVFAKILAGRMHTNAASSAFKVLDE